MKIKVISNIIKRFVCVLKGGIDRTGPGDKVSEVLIPLQEKLKHELERSSREVDRAKKAQAKVSFSIF